MTMTMRVGIQEQRRLFRESLALLLRSEPDIELVETAAEGPDLIELCETHEPDLVLLQTDADGWDVIRLVTTLRRRHPGLRMIGLHDDLPPVDVARARGAGVGSLVSRAEGIPALLDVMRLPAPLLPAEPAMPAAHGSAQPTPAPSDLRPALSPREVQVLQLVSAGRTAREISDVLAISPKTVENHKQRVFHKLSVQNQAHAVAIAMRWGLLVPRELDAWSGP